MTRRIVRLGAAVVAVAALVASYHFWWGRRPSPDDQLRIGRAAVAVDDIETANRIATSLGPEHPDHALVLRADIRLRQGDPRAAVELINRVTDKGDLRREAIALAGQCQLQLQNLSEAERAFQFVLSERSDHIDGHRGLAAVYYDQGALLKCLHHLAEVARLDPNDGRPHRMMGLIQANLDRRAEAVDCYRESLRRGLAGPAAAEVREELAEQLLKLGQQAAALDALGPAAETESLRATAVRAEADWASGRGPAAVVRLDAALPKYSDAPSLLRLRGQLHAEAGEWEKAVDVLERAVKADPADLTGLHQLSVAYDRSKRTADAEAVRRRHESVKEDLSALTTLNREADARPWDPAVREKLAAVCDRLGKVQLAAMWRRAAAVGATRFHVGAVP